MYPLTFPFIRGRITAKKRLRPKQEKLLRIIADVLLINAAVFTSVVIRFVVLVAFEPTNGQANYGDIFRQFLINYRDSVWLLILICLTVFALSGFYSYGRAYRGRYKALVVAQAVSLAYLIFGFVSYFVGGKLGLPHGALLLAWILSVGMLVVARVWALLWANVIRSERKSRPIADQRIRNVLLIGGAGYIGSALLPKLLDKGYHVRVLDLCLYGTEPIQDALNHPRLELMRADFREVDKVVEAMTDMDAVIHLGAIVGDPACALDEDLTIEVNLMATRMIAEVASGSGVGRLIFASTCSVYGASEEILKNEYSDLNPVSLYARSKIASEQVLMAMASPTFAPTCLRFSTIYGLSGRTRFDLVVNLLTAKALVDGVITVFDGDQWRSFLHVDDAARSLLETLTAPVDLVRSQVFNVGSNEQNYTIQQVGEIINRHVPTAKLVTMGSSADRRNYQVDCSKIRKTLAFVPRWTLEQGVQQVIETVRSGAVRDYQDAKYSNVKFFTNGGASHIQCVNGWADELINRNPGLALARAAAAAQPE